MACMMRILDVKIFLATGARELFVRLVIATSQDKRLGAELEVFGGPGGAMTEAWEDDAMECILFWWRYDDGLGMKVFVCIVLYCAVLYCTCRG